ncbi:MAG: oligosaccharide flippase family protein [candidate division Zixibacteria bacterium]|nr:oligosaccharide flippase family protein [candidate division Zixibacteria bacterium]
MHKDNSGKTVEQSCSAPLKLTGKLLAKNTVFNLAGHLIPMVVAVITIPIIIGALGVERFGILTLAWMVVGYFSLFDMGLGRATTKFVAEYLGLGDSKMAGRLIWASLLMLSGFGVLGTAIAILLTPWLVNSVLNIPSFLLEESIDAFYLLAFSIPIVSMTTGARGILEAQQRFDIVNYIKVPTYLTAFIAPLMVLPFSHSLFPIVAVLIGSRLLGLLAYMYFCMRTLPGMIRPSIPDLALIKQLLSYGGWLTLSHLIWPIMTYMDRFIIGAMVTMAAVAYYVTPYELVSKILIITGSVLAVAFPAMSMYAREQHEKFMQLFDRAIKYLLMILVPAIFVLIVLSKPILGIWLGKDFVIHSAIVLQLLALGKLINSIGQVPSSAVQAMGRPDITAKLHMIELPIYLVMLYLMVKYLGILGAAIAWTIRVAIDLGLYLIIFRRLSSMLSGLKPKFKFDLIVWSAFMMGAGFLLSAVTGPAVNIPAAILMLAGSAVICWHKFFDNDEKDFVRNFVHRFFRRKSPVNEALQETVDELKSEEVKV